MNKKVTVIASIVITVIVLIACCWVGLRIPFGDKISTNATATIPAEAGAKEGDLEARLKEATETIERNPKSAEAYEHRGRLYRDKFDFKSALADLTKSIDLNPERDSAYFSRSQCYWHTHQSDQALADVVKAIKLRPSAEGHTLRSMYYLDKKKFDLARHDIEAAISLDKQHTLAHVARFRLNLQTGHKSEALQDAKRALSLAPVAETHLLLGQVFRVNNDFENALRELNRAAEMSPEPQATLHFERAIALEGMKNYKQAASDYTICAELMPAGAPYAYFGRGRCFRRMGNFSDAIRDFTSVIQSSQDPNVQGIAYEERANAYIALGEAEKADRDIEILISRFPKGVNVAVLKRRRVQLLIAQKKFREAVDVLDELIKANPGSAEDLEQRTRIYQHLGQSAKARH